MARRVPRILAAILVLLVALSILGLAHVYIAKRLVLDPCIGEPLRTLLLGAIAVLGASLLLHFPAERLLRPPLLRVVSWPPLLWMGVLWVTVTTLAASEGVLWLLGAAPPTELPTEPLLAARGRALCVATVVCVATLLGVRSALRPPAVRRVEVAMHRWPRALEGFRVVQISDLHIGPILGRRFAAALVQRVNALDPDLIALTGDLVDGNVAHVGEEVAPLAGLRARRGVYFVTGNHDYYSGAGAWVRRVEELGIRPLRNERVQIGEPGARFELAGVDDHRGDWVRGSAEDLGRALGGRDANHALLLLAHDPSTFKRASSLGVDLQISGHTHGGQIWPFGYLVRLVVPFVAGLYRRGAAQLYVSRGTGFWGPPLRLLAPAEITELTLRAIAPGAASNVETGG